MRRAVSTWTQRESQGGAGLGHGKVRAVFVPQSVPVPWGVTEGGPSALTVGKEAGASPEGSLRGKRGELGRTGEVQPGRPPGRAHAGQSCAPSGEGEVRMGGTVATLEPAPPRGRRRAGM